jgi:hypothetical protein
MLQNLVVDLCFIAGSQQGASPGNLFSAKALKVFAAPDPDETPAEQGTQILKWLRIEVAEWNREIILTRGDNLSAIQARDGFWLLLNLSNLPMKSEERRLRVVDSLNLHGRVGWAHWRKNIESDFLEHLARYLVENYPERVEAQKAS